MNRRRYNNPDLDSAESTNITTSRQGVDDQAPSTSAPPNLVVGYGATNQMGSMSRHHLSQELPHDFTSPLGNIEALPHYFIEDDVFSASAHTPADPPLNLSTTAAAAAAATTSVDTHSFSAVAAADGGHTQSRRSRLYATLDEEDDDEDVYAPVTGLTGKERYGRFKQEQKQKQKQRRGKDKLLASDHQEQEREQKEQEEENDELLDIERQLVNEKEHLKEKEVALENLRDNMRQLSRQFSQWLPSHPGDN